MYFSKFTLFVSSMDKDMCKGYCQEISYDIKEVYQSLQWEEQGLPLILLLCHTYVLFHLI